MVKNLGIPYGEVLAVNVTRPDRYFTLASGFLPLKNTGKVPVFVQRSETQIKCLMQENLYRT